MPNHFDPVKRKARFRGGILGFMAVQSLGFAFILWQLMGALRDHEPTVYAGYRELADALMIGFVVGAGILLLAGIVAYVGTHALNA